MTNEELQHLVERLSIERFHWHFKHLARFNSRLRSTGGRYLLVCHTIEINPKVIQLYDYEELEGIIVHELCHYHLHRQGRGYQHRDQEFKELLKKTKGLRYCRPLIPAKRNFSPYHQYYCEKCKQAYFRQRRVNTFRYRCGCGGELVKI